MNFGRGIAEKKEKRDSNMQKTKTKLIWSKTEFVPGLFTLMEGGGGGGGNHRFALKSGFRPISYACEGSPLLKSYTSS